jgi:hypothetical protein
MCVESPEAVLLSPPSGTIPRGKRSFTKRCPNKAKKAPVGAEIPSSKFQNPKKHQVPSLDNGEGRRAMSQDLLATGMQVIAEESVLVNAVVLS